MVRKQPKYRWTERERHFIVLDHKHRLESAMFGFQSFASPMKTMMQAFNHADSLFHYEDRPVPRVATRSEGERGYDHPRDDSDQQTERNP